MTTHRSTRAAAGTVGISLSLAVLGLSQSGAASAATGCDAYASYGTFSNVAVTVLSSIRDAEADNFEKSFVDFESCTGIDIVWEGTADFETTLQARVDAGKAPDLAVISQPGLLANLATQGVVKPASAAVKTQAEANYSKDWLAYGTVKGTFYAPPLGANVKSLVWYSPAVFAENGWTVPQTWADLKKLTADVAAKGVTPWCAGIESGDATGWPATDWLEDVLLRTAGPSVYDRWVSHAIPFDDPQVAGALDEVGSILRNTSYVNGGHGDVASIATTAFQEGGLPVLDGTCALHRQASFYANMWPTGTTVAPDGDVHAFYLPGPTATSKPVLGGGEFLAAFDDAAATQAVQLLMGSETWVNTKAALGGWLTANNRLTAANVSNPIDKLSVQILQDPSAVFRFDGSDLMPAAVGAGSFWTEMTKWINGASTADTLSAIEASWPAA